MSANYENCPICHKTIEVFENYSKWCEHCYWNAGTANQTKSRSVFEMVYQRLTKKGGQRLFDNLKNLNLHLEQGPHASLKWVKLLSFLIYFLYFLFFTLALTITTYGYLNNSFILVVGIVLMSVVYIIWPWRQKKKETVSMVLKNHTSFQRLIKDISDTLKVSVPETILLTDKYSVGIQCKAYSNKRTLLIGLPLWKMLNNDEKISLLAYLIGQLKNTGPLRRQDIWGAIRLLYYTADLIYPKTLLSLQISESEALPHTSLALFNTGRLITFPINLAMRAIARSIQNLGSFMIMPLWREIQEAEYRADLYSLRLTSTATNVNRIKKSHLEFFLWEYARAHLLKKESTSLVFEKALQHWQSLPEKEKQRHEYLMQQEKYSIEASHPPMIFRLEMLKTQQKYVPCTPISSPNWQKIGEELRPYTEIIANKVIDTVRNSLYE